MRRGLNGVHAVQEVAVADGLITFNFREERLMEIPAKSVTNANLAHNELVVEVNDEDARPGDDVLVEVRLSGPESTEASTALERAYQAIRENTKAEEMSDPTICVLPNLPFVVPRGRFNAQFAEKYIKLHGASFNYSITYKNIIKAFWLELPGRETGCFVIGFDKPLIQGQTDYKYTVIQFKTAEEVEVEMGPRYDELPRINEHIERSLHDKFYEVFTRIFKVFTGLGVVVPGDFKSSRGEAALPCSIGARQGNLFLLNKSLIFILRPVVHVRFDEIARAVFHRVSSGHVARGFDLEVMTKAGTSFTFSGIDRSESESVMAFLKTAGVLIEAVRDEALKDEEYEDEEDDEEEESRKSGKDDDSEEADDDFIAQDGEESDEDEDDDFEGEESDEEEEKPKAKKATTGKKNGAKDKKKK